MRICNIVVIMDRQKSILKALQILSNKSETLTDDEIKELIDEIDSPLERLYPGGYRLYHNDKNWNCHFCGIKIDVHRGYWGGKEMIMNWSKGAKMCHKCYLKFLLMMEDNEYIILLLEKLRGKELKILEWLASS